jgi:ABC-type dipeptide/oligopeptide/nickel transport system permease component
VGPAWVLSWVLGLLLAAVTVRLRISRWFDGLAAILQMIPEVVLASLLTWWLLVYGRVAVDSVWLPLLPVTLGLAPTVFLHAAGSLAAAVQSRPVQLAILAKLPSARLGWQYLLPAAANPLLSLLGPTLVAAFGATLLAEAVTGWPGVGTLFLEAFRSRDYPVTQAILLLMGGTLAVVNAVTELLLFRLDPRIRYAAE